MMLKDLIKKFGVLLVLTMLVAVCVGAVSAAGWTTYQGNEQRNAYLPDDIGPQTNNIFWSINSTLWDTKGDGYLQAPVIKDGKIYYSIFHAHAYPSVLCYDIQTQKEVWNTSFYSKGGGRCGITVTDNYLYVGSYDGSKYGQLYCLDSKTGEIIGKTDVIANQGFVGLSSTAAVTKDTVWINSLVPETILYGYSLDLKEEKYKISLPNATGSMYSSPSLSSDETVIYVPSNGGVEAYSTSTGELIWTADFGLTYSNGYQPSTPVYNNGIIYFTDGKSQLFAVDAKTGEKIWYVSCKVAGKSAPVVTDSKIIVGTGTGLSAYSLDGKLLWTYKGASSSANSPIVVGDTVYYAGSYSAVIAAVNADDGSLLWTYNAPGKKGYNSNMFEGGAAYDNGILYFTDMMKLYAFADGYSLDLGLVTVVNPNADEVYYTYDSILFDSVSKDDVEDRVNESTLVWDFGDDNTANGKSVSHVFTKSGKYLVKLSGLTESGLPVVDEITISVAGHKPVISELKLTGTGISEDGQLTLTIGAANTNSIYPTGTLIAEVNDQYGDVVPDAKVTWISDNETVLKVNQGGIYTTYAAGTANVTVSCVENKSLTKIIQFSVVKAEEQYRISIMPNDVEFVVGDSLQFSAVVVSQYGTVSDGSVSWSSSNSAVASVDTSGKVTALSAGTSSITASCGDASTTITVTVKGLAPASIEIHAPSSVTVGDSGRFTATVLDQKGQVIPAEIKWTSSSSNRIKILNPTTGTWRTDTKGSVTITATVFDDNNNKITAKHKISVSDRPTPDLDKLFTWNVGNVYIAVALNNTAGIINGATYQWTVDGAPLTGNTPIVQTSGSTVNVTVTAGNIVKEYTYQSSAPSLLGLVTPAVPGTSVDAESPADTPAVDVPVDAESPADTPASDVPVDDESSVDTPAVDVPVDDESSVDTPAVDVPVDDDSSVDTPAVDVPVDDESSVDTPAVDVPVNDDSSVDTPAVDVPVDDESTDEILVDDVLVDDESAEDIMISDESIEGAEA